MSKSKNYQLMEQSGLTKNAITGGRGSINKVISAKIMDAMQQHIGREKAISKSQLFAELFNKKYRGGDLADYFRWMCVRKVMHILRLKSHCFIASDYDQGEPIFFVLKSQSDANVYIDQAENAIHRIRALERRAQRAVDEQWYKEEQWMIERTPSSRIGFDKK